MDRADSLAKLHKQALSQFLFKRLRHSIPLAEGGQVTSIVVGEHHTQRLVVALDVEELDAAWDTDDALKNENLLYGVVELLPLTELLAVDAFDADRFLEQTLLRP